MGVFLLAAAAHPPISVFPYNVCTYVSTITGTLYYCCSDDYKLLRYTVSIVQVPTIYVTVVKLQQTDNLKLTFLKTKNCNKRYELYTNDKLYT